MSRWVPVVPLFALTYGTNGANAARTLLAELLARPPVEPSAAVMSTPALETCVRRAQELDRTGTAIDYEIAAINREVAEGGVLAEPTQRRAARARRLRRAGGSRSFSAASSAMKSCQKNFSWNFRFIKKSRGHTRRLSLNLSAIARAASAAAISKRSRARST